MEKLKKTEMLRCPSTDDIVGKLIDKVNELIDAIAKPKKVEKKK